MTRPTIVFMDGKPLLPECDVEDLVFPCRKKRGVFRNEQEYMEYQAGRNQRRMMSRISSGRKKKNNRIKIIKQARKEHNKTDNVRRGFRQVRFKPSRSRSRSKSKSKSRSKSRSKSDKEYKDIVKYAKSLSPMNMDKDIYFDILDTSFGYELVDKHRWKLLQIYKGIKPKSRRRRSLEESASNRRKNARRRMSTYVRHRRSA